MPSGVGDCGDCGLSQNTDAIVLPGLTSTSREARRFEKALEKALRGAVKGTPWRAKQGIVFRELDSFFYEGKWDLPYKKDEKPILAIKLCVKPMAVDPLLWDAMNEPDNHKEPLSFRAWGWFTCGAPSLWEDVIENSMEVEEYASEIIRKFDGAVPEIMQLLNSKPFSEIAKQAYAQNDKWKMEETIVFSLLLEGKEQEAKEVAGSFVHHSMVEGKSGNSFIDIATSQSNSGSFVDNLISKLKRGEL